MMISSFYSCLSGYNAEPITCNYAFAWNPMLVVLHRTCSASLDHNRDQSQVSALTVRVLCASAHHSFRTAVV
eukprot:6486192-Amphidinium_carterae.1